MSFAQTAPPSTDIRVRLPDGGRYRLEHLDRGTFSLCGAAVPPYGVLRAIFDIAANLSVEAMSMPHPRDGDADAQLFSFVGPDRGVLERVRQYLTPPDKS